MFSFSEDNKQTNRTIKIYLKKKITKMGGEVFVYDQISDISFTSNKLIFKKLILKKLLL